MKPPQPLKKEKVCYLCVNNLRDVDYKNGQLLRRFINTHMRILPKKRTGVCSKHQRKVVTAIKRARILAILPFTSR